MGRPKGLPKTGGRLPGGPNKATRAIKEIAEPYSEAAVATLAAIMDDPTMPAAARVAAAGQLSDRAHGRPHQTSDVKVEAERFVMALPAVAESEEEWLKQLQ